MPVIRQQKILPFISKCPVWVTVFPSREPVEEYKFQEVRHHARLAQHCVPRAVRAVWDTNNAQ